jgi:two-component system, response regulator PdtaR
MGSPRLRVLVVDDHAIIAAGIACLLRELGHRVVAIVGTGEEAISSAERHKPDLIVMDVRLDGDVNGIEAALEIRKRLGIRSILFSGYLDRETRERATVAEPIAFVDKTASQADLARVINSAAAASPNADSASGAQAL